MFIKFSSILFILLPISLILGPFFSDLSISLISLIFLFNIKFDKIFSFLKNKYFILFIIFWLYIIFNSLIQNQNIDSLKISFFYFRFGLFVLATIFLLEENRNILKYFFYTLLFSFCILIIDGYIQFFSGKNILEYQILEGSRISSFFEEELILGSYISRLFPVLFGMFILFDKKIKNKKLNYFIILIFIFSEVLVFLSGERAAFFYINLSALFMIIFFNKYKKIRIVSFSISILLIILLSAIKPDAYNRIFVNTYNQMNLSKILKNDTNSSLNINSKTNHNKVYIFSIDHTHHYLSAIKMFKDNIILGVGVKNFRHFCSNPEYKISEYSCSTHPHNTYIQLLSETGIIGFFLVLIILISFCFYSLKHLILKLKKEYFFNDFEISMLSAILISLWPIVPTGNFFNNWTSIIYYLPVGILFWSLKKRKLID